jgi:plasmid stabilization system protein ParE
VVTQRFQRNTHAIHRYICEAFSKRAADSFLDRLLHKIEQVSHHPEMGRPSSVLSARSFIVNPHNLVFYRVTERSIIMLCIFDMRKNPDKMPY